MRRHLLKLFTISCLCALPLTLAACGNASTSAVSTTECTHEYSHVTTEPTLEEQGFTTHTCGLCGHSYVDAYTDPLTGVSLQYDDYVPALDGITVSDGPVITGDDCLEIVTKNGVAYFHAKDIGVATVTANGRSIAVGVDKARLHIMLVMGQSNAGNHFKNATSDVRCEIGSAYWWSYNSPVTDHTETTMGWHAPFLAEYRAQSVAAGDPEKPVLIWREGETTRSGKAITSWATSSTNTSGTDGTAKMVKQCIEYFTAPERADKYEIVNSGLYWLQGEATDEPVYYTECFMAIYNRLKALGIDYCAFFRVRQGGDGNRNSADHNDLSHHGALRAQLEMVNTYDDMYLCTDITENWYGVTTAKHSIDISKYVTMMESYGKRASYTDEHGNRAMFKNGVLTTYMPELFGKNNLCHYGKFGYGIIGADAAYNIYRALHQNDFGIVYSDTSGTVHNQIRAKAGETHAISLSTVSGMLTFRPDCYSTAGTLSFKITSGDTDITNESGLISTEENTYGGILATKLATYSDVAIAVTYTTVSGAVGSVTFTVVNQ